MVAFVQDHYRHQALRWWAVLVLALVIFAVTAPHLNRDVWTALAIPAAWFVGYQFAKAYIRNTEVFLR